MLSHTADATFLVVRENFTKRDQIKDAYDQLQKAGGNVTGVIMNYCRHQSSEYYYSYYYKEGDGGSASSYESTAEPRNNEVPVARSSHASHIQAPSPSHQGSYIAATKESAKRRNPYLDPRS